MRRPVVTVTVTDVDRKVVHEETRRAFNAGIRAGEAAVREIARAEGTTYAGDVPMREGDHYMRPWRSELGRNLWVAVQVTEAAR